MNFPRAAAGLNCFAPFGVLRIDAGRITPRRIPLPQPVDEGRRDVML